MLNVVMYWVGWLLFVLGQAQNSINSPSNNLNGWAGFKGWVALHWYTLLLRAFFSVIGEVAVQHYIVGQVGDVLVQHGLTIAAWGMAGISGFAANTVLYQGFGLLGNKIPWLRVEVPVLAPAGPSQPQAVMPLEIDRGQHG